MNKKSQLGSFFFLNGNLISGTSNKSSVTCTSSTEAEIYAFSNAFPRIKNLEMLVTQLNHEYDCICTILTDSLPTIDLIARDWMWGLY